MITLSIKERITFYQPRDFIREQTFVEFEKVEAVVLPMASVRAETPKKKLTKAEKYRFQMHVS